MRRARFEDRPEIPIAPMIDCVFLMLVYFMTTSSLEKSEADLAFPLGGRAVAVDPLPAVDEQQLVLDGQDRVVWNGSLFPLGTGGRDGRERLTARLVSFRETCGLAGSKPSVRILPSGESSFQGLVSLLDALAKSGIEAVSIP
jgi:biopolymer transport protein ExbD